MADAPIVDVDAAEDDSPKVPKTNDYGRSRKRKKSATSSSPENLTAGEKEARVEALQKELDGLFGYYNEVKIQKVRVELSECGSREAVIALLMEESELPLSALVEEICERLRSAGSGGTVVVPVTRASVKSSVVSIGQRIAYGVPNAEADVLEDHSESCFWCWETRDVKLIPHSVRGHFIVRRICRGRIHERIVAVSEMISSLRKPESEQNYNHGLIKASAVLCKVYNEADIRLLVHGLVQKISVDMDLKKAKREEKLLLKQLDRNRKEVEIGKESMHSELQRDTLLSEKDSKMLRGDSGEASKDEKCNAKDVCENRKQKKQQPGETERDRRHREKEESELKKKHSLQKQASFMERFLKRSKPSHSFQNDQFSRKSVVCDSSVRKIENMCESATLSMDVTLTSSGETTLEDIRKSHFSLWHDLGKSIRLNGKQRWGIRWKPKSELYKELKLASITRVAHNGDLAMEKHVDRLGENSYDIISDPLNADSYLLNAKYCHGKQLLQFDNSHRPAFYGIWSIKSQVVGPRHPFRKEPSLDYDVNSDEEWEEEDPGESLSDCDKDEEECSDECSKSDDESDDDGFFVPDGYLSEDEGAQVDKMETVIDIEGSEDSPSGKDVEREEFCALLRQQKNLNNLTENALKKNQLLIIMNLMHDKELGQTFSGTLKLEQMCLQSLSMRVMSASSYVEISVDHFKDEDQAACLSTGGYYSDLSSGHKQSVKKSLQQTFPSASKSLLGDKALEISDYVDNHLQVKKEVLVKLGGATYPDKSCLESRSTTTSRASESVKPGETSLLSSL